MSCHVHYADNSEDCSRRQIRQNGSPLSKLSSYARLGLRADVYGCHQHTDDTELRDDWEQQSRRHIIRVGDKFNRSGCAAWCMELCTGTPQNT